MIVSALIGRRILAIFLGPRLIRANRTVLLSATALRHDELVAPRANKDRNYGRRFFVSPTGLSIEIFLILRHQEVANRIGQVLVPKLCIDLA